jgi:hypothetical protein
VPRLLGQTFNGESNVVGEIIQLPTAEKWKEFSMSTRMDYTQIAAKLDYAALEKKLEQLTQREPPRKRKTAADVLEPLRERLLALRGKGWKIGELAEELKVAGVPVSPACLRECLSRWTAGGDTTAKSRTRRRPKYAPSNTQPTITTGQVGRSNDSQTGQRVTTR